MNKSKIFISYSHRGNGLAWKDRLINALALFENQHLLDFWHDEEMALGENWHERIKASMQSARLAILLLTDEMLKSPFVLQHEFPELARRHREEGLIVAPILCEECDWPGNKWVASLQIKPRVQTDPTPLATLSTRDCDSALRKLATEIAEQISHATLAELAGRDAPPSSSRIYLDKFPLTGGPRSHEERLIGREQELALLDLAFAQSQMAIVTLVGWGGVGKTVLVQHWLRHLQTENWYGVRRVYAWSFYSQGTTEDRQASEDTFLAHALEWFDVKCEPTLSPWDKGRLLAQAITKEPTLLILDGIEPLQYPPGPMGGQLRAPGVQSLLKLLARKAGDVTHSCLCLVTTREPLTDLSDFERRPDGAWGSVLRLDLGNLIDEAGATLLHHTGAKRAGAAEIKNDDAELLAASREVDGHALTLNLLGRFLARAHGGDIRRRDLVKFEEADRAEQGGTTFKMLAAFENWFANEGDIEARALAILRILGLFDRPADSGCLAALREPPVITGFTEPLFVLKRDSNSGEISEQALSDKGWNDAVHFLEDFGLVVIQSNYNETERLIDCHPLVREHFGKKLKKMKPEGWQVANSRLYNYLKANGEYLPLTIEAVQPLLQSVAHGCQAGLYSDAFSDPLMSRVKPATSEQAGNYSWRKMGTDSSDLQVLAFFFETPWQRVVPTLPASAQAWVLNESAYCLRTLGRLSEAIQAIGASVIMGTALHEFDRAAIRAGNAAELELIVGSISNAVEYAEMAVDLSEKIDDWRCQVASKCTLAYTLYNAGQWDDAFALFLDAEITLGGHDGVSFLYSLSGFWFCDILLNEAEWVAWRFHIGTLSDNEAVEVAISRSSEVNQRTGFMFKAVQFDQNTVDIALIRLMLSRALICWLEINFSDSDHKKNLGLAGRCSMSAVDDLRKATETTHLPKALIARSWLRILEGNVLGSIADLDEAWDIASRGPMRLHMADICLYRVRLFFREEHYPWESPEADLAAAEKLINECGYHRRDKELADAKRAILGL